MKKMSLGLKIAGVAMGGFLVIGTVSWQMLKMGRERTAERLASKMESEIHEFEKRLPN